MSFLIIMIRMNNLMTCLCVFQIVREQTEKVFSSESFLDIDVNSVVFIVRQDTLNCAEVDIWRAVVKWAIHKGNVYTVYTHNIPIHSTFIS